MFYEYELTDHATTFFSIDFLPTDTRPVVFRAHPSLLKRPNYKCLIDNTIKYMLLNEISDKSCKFYNRNLDLLNRKISLQEEIETLRRLEKYLKGSVTEYILLFSAEMLKAEDSEVPTEDILDKTHDTNDDLLLETVLFNMRESTFKMQDSQL